MCKFSTEKCVIVAAAVAITCMGVCVHTYIHSLRMQPNVRLDIGKNRCIININIGSSSSGSDSNTNNINKNNCCMHKMRGGRVRERTSCTVSACAAASASMHESPWTAVVPSTWVTHLTTSPFQIVGDSVARLLCGWAEHEKFWNGECCHKIKKWCLFLFLSSIRGNSAATLVNLLPLTFPSTLCVF